MSSLPSRMVSVICSLGAIAGCATQQAEPAAGAATGAVFTVPSAQARQDPAASGHSTQSAHAAQKSFSGKPAMIPEMRSVYYDFDQYEVKPEFRKRLDAHARYLREHPQTQVRIEGNGDERGSREYNLALGQRRAESVRQTLRLLGARDGQLEATSLGEEKPRAAGHGEAAWAENRRSDLVYE
jgi:peptidoglycan-associated lipoprotein